MSPNDLMRGGRPQITDHITAQAEARGAAALLGTGHWHCRVHNFQLQRTVGCAQTKQLEQVTLQLPCEVRGVPCTVTVKCDLCTVRMDNQANYALLQQLRLT